MKLRLRGNTVRFRLSGGEVARLASHGRVEETTRLGSADAGALTYAVELAAEADEIGARLCEGELRVIVPEKVGLEWARGESVGLYSSLDSEGAKVAVEKDYRCLTPRHEGEDSVDAYPHPREADGSDGA